MRALLLILLCATAAMAQGSYPGQPLLNWGSGPMPNVAGSETALVAEGFGASVTGGQGGVSLVVDTLNDTVDTACNTAACLLASKGADGHISLREALHGAGGAGTMGARIITFDAALSGTINLASAIELENGNPGNYDSFTLDGSGAANYGVQIITNGLIVRCNNTIVRYFKSRNGATASSSIDAMNYDGGTNFVADHCSFGAGDDGDCDIVGTSHDGTIQWCIIGPGFGSGNSLIKGASETNISYHHNLMVKSDGGASRWPECASGAIDFVNNAMYNDSTPNGRLEAQSAWPPDDAAVLANIVGNYFQQGPDVIAYSSAHPVIYFYSGRTFSSTSSFYVASNVVADHSGIITSTQNQIYGNDPATINGSPFGYPTITTTNAATAYTQVLAGSGARLPCGIDSWDGQVVTGVTNATITVWDNQADLGGFPNLSAACSQSHQPTKVLGKVALAGRLVMNCITFIAIPALFVLIYMVGRNARTILPLRVTQQLWVKPPVKSITASETAYVRTRRARQERRERVVARNRQRTP